MNNIMKSKTLLFAGIIGLVGWIAPTAAAPVQLTSHQAVYDLELKELSANSTIQAVRGRIALRIEQQCEGLIMNQRMVLEMINIEGGTIISDYNLTTWEDNQGNLMRFDMSNRLNNRQIDKYSGVAERFPDKASVTFSEPELDEMVLPKDVMFPGEHTRSVLAAANAGKNLLSAKIFDGNGEEGLSDTLAVIGKRKTLVDPSEIEIALKGKNYWSLQLSFFDLSEQTNEPDYEVGMKMFENGIATDLVLKYRDFSLSGNVSDLKILEPEKCS
jgi:EipB-like